jgi:hypothetical protein
MEGVITGLGMGLIGTGIGNMIGTSAADWHDLSCWDIGPIVPRTELISVLSVGFCSEHTFLLLHF